jgi:hypothetical protein
VFVQEGNITRTSFPLRWKNVLQDVLVLVKEGRLACAIFSPMWNDFF